MVNVVKTLSGILESSTDWVYNQATIHYCFVLFHLACLLPFQKQNPSCLNVLKGNSFEKKKLLRNWKEINVFAGWWRVANGWHQEAKSVLSIVLGMVMLNGFLLILFS